MKDETNGISGEPAAPASTGASQRGRVELRLIGLLFLLPLVLMLVTSIVCIAVIFARN